MTAYPSEISRHHMPYVPCVLARTCDVVLTLCHQLRPTERFPAVRGAEVPGFGPISPFSLPQLHPSRAQRDRSLSYHHPFIYIYIVYNIQTGRNRSNSQTWRVLHNRRRCGKRVLSTFLACKFVRRPQAWPRNSVDGRPGDHSKGAFRSIDRCMMFVSLP
jgi:hypothetical protein